MTDPHHIDADLPARCLVVMQAPPKPIRHGGHLRASQTIKALGAITDVGVVILAPARGTEAVGHESDPPTDSRYPTWRSTSTGARHADEAFRVALRWLREPGGHPSDRWWTADARQALETALEEFDPELVVLEQILTRHALPLVQRHGAKVVYDAYNHEANLSRAMAEEAGGVTASPAVANLLAERSARIEAELAGQVDQIWVCSEPEADEFRRSYPGCAQVAAIPNGADLGPGVGDPRAARPPLILLPASYAYPPNKEAALFLIDQVLPPLRRRVPEARLVLAGTGPPPELFEAAGRHDGVEVTGAVEDMNEWFRRATVVPLAIFSGAGTRYKGIEVFAAGVPTVSTPMGVFGLEAVAGEHYLPAETAEEFAAAIAELCEHPELRARIVDSARNLVAERYSRPVIERLMAEAIASIEGVPA